jgi:hypothetical protein
LTLLLLLKNFPVLPAGRNGGGAKGLRKASLRV